MIVNGIEIKTGIKTSHNRLIQAGFTKTAKNVYAMKFKHSKTIVKLKPNGKVLHITQGHTKAWQHIRGFKSKSGSGSSVHDKEKAKMFRQVSPLHNL